MCVTARNYNSWRVITYSKNIGDISKNSIRHTYSCETLEDSSSPVWLVSNVLDLTLRPKSRIYLHIFEVYNSDLFEKQSHHALHYWCYDFELHGLQNNFTISRVVGLF